MKRIRLTSLAWLFSCQRTICDKKSADSLARQTWKIETCQKLVKTFYLTISWCLEFLSSGHFLVTALPLWLSAYEYQPIKIGTSSISLDLTAVKPRTKIFCGFSLVRMSLSFTLLR